MSVCYTAAVGNPPAANTYAWKEWYFRLLNYRLAECPIARGTTYYFDQSGGTIGADGLTAATAKSSLTEAQAIIDGAPSGDVALLFKRGEKWISPDHGDGLILDNPDITVASYGDTSLAKPVFSRFNKEYTSGWTEEVAGTHYSRSEADQIAWLRDGAASLTAYQSMALSGTPEADVVATPGSFWYDDASNELHLHCFGNVDPGTLTIHAVETQEGTNSQPTYCGVNIEETGCRVDGIWFEGQGMRMTTDNGKQIHGIRAELGPTDVAVISNCEAYYNSSHAMGQWTGSGEGGYSVWMNCKAGYTQYTPTGGETVFNAYAEKGLIETIYHQCECHYGSLPEAPAIMDSGNAVGSYKQGFARYAHTDGAAGSDINLWISYGFVFRNSGWGCEGIGSPNHADIIAYPTANLIDTRVFIVEDDFVGDYVSRDHLFRAYPAVINGSYIWALHVDNTTGLLGFQSQHTMTGWMYNTLHRCQGATPTGNNRFLGVSDMGGGVVLDFEVYFSHLVADLNAANFRFSFDTNSRASNADDAGFVPFKNTIIHDEADVGFGYFGVNNNLSGTGLQVANASEGLVQGTDLFWGWNNDAEHVELAAKPGILADPVAALAGAACTIGATCEFDINWNPRPAAPAIGPVDKIAVGGLHNSPLHRAPYFGIAGMHGRARSGATGCATAAAGVHGAGHMDF